MIKHVRGESAKLSFGELRAIIQNLQKQLFERNVAGVEQNQHEAELKEVKLQVESMQHELRDVNELLRQKELSRATLQRTIDDITRSHNTKLNEAQMQLKLATSELKAKEETLHGLMCRGAAENSSSESEELVVAIKSENLVLQQKCELLEAEIAQERYNVEENQSAFDVATERCAELEAELEHTGAEQRLRLHELEVEGLSKQKSLESLTAICELRRGELEQVTTSWW